jgi:hypothetical protein
MTDTSLRAPARLLALSLSVLLSAGCASNGGGLVPDQPARLAGSDTPVKRGDCATALQRVAERPNAYVDRLPSPKKMVPSPLPVKSMPADVRRARYNAVKITVLVDTLGRADMKTFNVVTSTNPWLAQSVKSAVAKWRFEPAQLAGCKVPRQFEWSATSGRKA